jgi:hypothetical protein
LHAHQERRIIHVGSSVDKHENKKVNYEGTPSLIGKTPLKFFKFKNNTTKEKCETFNIISKHSICNLLFHV